MLNKIFGKNFSFLNSFANKVANFIIFFTLPWIRTLHVHVSLLHSLFLLFNFCLFAYLIAFLFVSLCGYHVFIFFVSTSFVSVYLHLFMFLWFASLCYNFTVIYKFLETYISVSNLVLIIYFVFLFIHLFVHAWIIKLIFLHFVVLIICNFIWFFCLVVCMLILMLILLHFIYVCFDLYVSTYLRP